MPDRVGIGSTALSVEISPLGAELQSLRDSQGRELMWSGDPAFWSGRAPLLFPIVGRLNADCYRLGDREYSLPKHGFARTSLFTLIDVGPDQATFRLCDSDASRAVYPFAFRLDAAFVVSGATLIMTVTIANPGAGALPASFGFHPAFAWPLPEGGQRADHAVLFDVDEPADLCAITADGLIGADSRRTPVSGRELLLRDGLFSDDALVWKSLNSRRLTYGARRHRALDIAFPDTEWLGIWTRPGAPFICIEPWAGMADPAGYRGDFRDKPGVFEIAPDESRAFRMSVTPTG